MDSISSIKKRIGEIHLTLERQSKADVYSTLIDLFISSRCPKHEIIWTNAMKVIRPD